MEVLNNIKKFTFLSVFMLLTSCLNGDCEVSKQHVLNVECLQIFERLPSFDSPFMRSEGRHLYTGFECVCNDETRWMSNYRDLLEKGDTIIKRRGELSFSIHKKDTIIEAKWECEGKVYE